MPYTSDRLHRVMDKLQVSREQINVVETITRNQQENPLWGEYRSGCVTASNFGEIIHFMMVKGRYQLRRC